MTNMTTEIPEKLVQSFLDGRGANTMRSYARALKEFADFLGEPTISASAARLLDNGPGAANSLVLDYRNNMLQRELAPATINHHLAAVRSLVKLAKTLGLVSWEVEIQNVPSRAYRDTRGPGQDGVVKMLAVLRQENSPAAYRNIAIIRLLFDRGLRRSEVAGLNLESVDAKNRRIRIRGKGRLEDEWLTIAAPTFDAIIDWITVRGVEPGPLFHNLDHLHEKGRLSDTSIYRMVVETGERAGIGHVRPHGLRHAAITHALDKTNGNIRAVAQFARHRKLDTTVLYDDARRDLGGQVAQTIALE